MLGIRGDKSFDLLNNIKFLLLLIPLSSFLFTFALINACKCLEEVSLSCGAMIVNVKLKNERREILQAFMVVCDVVLLQCDVC